MEIAVQREYIYFRPRVQFVKISEVQPATWTENMFTDTEEEDDTEKEYDIEDASLKDNEED